MAPGWKRTVSYGDMKNEQMAQSPKHERSLLVENATRQRRDHKEAFSCDSYALKPESEINRKSRVSQNAGKSPPLKNMAIRFIKHIGYFVVVVILNSVFKNPPKLPFFTDSLHTKQIVEKVTETLRNMYILHKSGSSVYIQKNYRNSASRKKQKY